MAKQPINVRLDDMTLEFMDVLVQYVESKDAKSNRTDIIQKAIFSFAREHLDRSLFDKIIDKHYKQPF